MLPNSHYTQDPDINENDAFETSSVSDGEVDLQCILPRPSLGQVDFATSQGLRVPSEIIPSNLSIGARNTPFTEVQRFVAVDWSVTVSRKFRTWGLIHRFTTGMLPHQMETQRRSARLIRSNTNLSICFVSCFIACNTHSIDKQLRIQAQLASSCPTVASRGPPSKEICKRRNT